MKVYVVDRRVAACPQMALRHTLHVPLAVAHWCKPHIHVLQIHIRKAHLHDRYLSLQLQVLFAPAIQFFC